jgi:hypothetical protein
LQKSPVQFRIATLAIKLSRVSVQPLSGREKQARLFENFAPLTVGMIREYNYADENVKQNGHTAHKHVYAGSL